MSERDEREYNCRRAQAVKKKLRNCEDENNGEEVTSLRRGDAKRGDNGEIKTGRQ